MAIDKAFRDADIVISFPQRDIHVKTVDAVLPGASGGEADPRGAPAE